MTTTNFRPGLQNIHGVQGASGGAATDPLQRLYALNPKLEAQVKADPGLRAFLEKNKAAIATVDPQSPPPGAAKT